jgi:hypothetical protein
VWWGSSATPFGLLTRFFLAPDSFCVFLRLIILFELLDHSNEQRIMMNDEHRKQHHTKQSKQQTTMDNTNIPTDANQPSRLRGPPRLACQTLSAEDMDVPGMEATSNILDGDVARTPAPMPAMMTARAATAGGSYSQTWSPSRSARSSRAWSPVWRSDRFEIVCTNNLALAIEQEQEQEVTIGDNSSDEEDEGDGVPKYMLFLDRLLG